MSIKPDLQDDNASRCAAFPQRHAEVDETIHVLEGSLAYRVDNEVRVPGVGDHCFSPRGSVHHFSNPSEVPAHDLVVFSPANVLVTRFIRDSVATG